MKKLYLTRHAKSSWKHAHLSDYDRPLKKRGLREAPLMANVLKEKGEIPDLLISSTANRAITTAQLMAQEWNYPIEKIIEKRSIYHADEEDLLGIIQATDNQYNSLMLFGHNPDFTDLANQLAQTNVWNIPTSGIFCIIFDVENWKEIDKGKGKKHFFDYPKLYR